MSATGRGGERAESDAYPTPKWCVARLLEAIGELPPGKYLEPCIGEGAIVEAVSERHAAIQQAYPAYGDLFWYGCDIRPVADPADDMFVGDFLSHECENWLVKNGPFAVTITNPPYALAQPIIERALECSDWVIMLLRVNYLASEDRSEFMRNTPPDVFVLPNRPSFLVMVRCVDFNNADARRGLIKACDYEKLVSPETAKLITACPKCGAKTRKTTSDSTEYAWFVWPPDRRRFCGKIQVLATTPLADRKI